jgi:heptosyltransferase-2
MNVEKLARLDDLLGEWLCLAAWRLGTPGPRPARGGKPKVLVAKLRSIGDVVLALPMLQALRAQGAEVTFLSGTVNRQWLALQPHLDRVIPVDLDTIWKSPRLLRLLRAIRRERFDAFIDLSQSSHFAALICLFSGAPMRIGFRTPNPKKRGKNRMYTHLIQFNHRQHIMRNYFALLAPLGVPVPPAISMLPLRYDDADEDLVDGFMAAANPDQRELVGVHLWGMIPAKRWPIGRWTETIAGLLASERRVLAVGSLNEWPAIEQVRAKLGSQAAAMVNCAGRFSLPQLFALMTRFRLFLANDGGPMHVAAAMGVPTLGLFGPETPVRYAPCNPLSLALYKGDGMECSPCSRPYDGSWPTCLHPACLERIESAEVLRVARGMLARAEAALPRA